VTVYRYRTVTTPCLGVVVDWRFELGSGLGPEVVEARAVDGGEELPRTHPIYGVLEALLEREPRNPLGALDALERMGAAS
jgi:hypothetical protein